MTAPLFTPVSLRDVALRNRVVIPPMCQYSAAGGMAGDYHLVHYGRLALGGAGLVILEATAVVPEGRITHGDLGIWSDAHGAALARIAAFLKAQGAAAGVQLAHAGRKASMQRPWEGNGPLSAEEIARGEAPWPIVAPSAVPLDEGWLMPAELSGDDLDALTEAFVAAARRAEAAGFDVIELHAAHGYLLHTFLSPLTNRREDAFGGDRTGRMRFPLRVARALREAWPAGKPLFVRVSAVDGLEGGLTLDDTLAFAGELRALGVDVLDCSSGGLAGSATAARIRRDYGFQVGFAEAVKRETGLSTMAVGLIVDPRQADAIVAEGRADLVAVGREALADPNWAVRASRVLDGTQEPGFEAWPQQAGWWLERREKDIARLGPWRA
ncbi:MULTISPECIES: NADH:flavin oxidoreductase/NADH oxidase [Methylobacterium]|jgi:2,4-dienoyl-CoA reductase-like NADH-dependent reductase (Old Yellow Enzyme family)|uniref:NADH:flavin oxidoreductase/NADH oxidase n=1 Tax=Methylobacterium TaxID=407 RepID=UPI0008EF5870|nr:MULTISPECIES: NADH:flavin oxidoreductase/NADH oxidase [Methylobacterium]MBZ6413306.1 NADH:flavin oxidoreductase/NADH oxidase [Methylobacterium sp.]MBK3400537.1 NADH:flavin oxidoreductase/NADH oxidase [Methylobacterium ajmalii]MBK3409592.1 NADH:flavin oxidoreductase/NADH oxidase [Methylobacterium ajmalii]MBK3420785.1 NADH:flavin oxidoreductase/NADH oxidase [Methylobacterium ajmalii]SFF45630.1 2,4-dienoyl-CoA reductase [Methylobacterium sp. yr596]